MPFNPFGILFLSSGLACFAAATPVLPSHTSFETTIQPFVAKHCVFCHNDNLKIGGLSLSAYHNANELLKDRGVWENVLRKLQSGEMPPRGRTPPTDAEMVAVTHWIEDEFARFDRNAKPDPGRVTAHRLNRYEYNNTIRDLLHIDFKPADNFPADDSGYGFNNIGDVLSLSPVLMEKYLAAAEEIAKKAIDCDPPLKATREKYQGGPRTHQFANGDMEVTNNFPVEADYDFRSNVNGRRDPLRISMLLDGRLLKIFESEPDPNKPRANEMRVHVPAGEHKVKVTLAKDKSAPRLPEPSPAEKAAAAKRPPPVNPFVDYIEIRGPFNQELSPVRESHRRIFICGHENGEHTPECARLIMSNLARRAWRRPVNPQEVDRLVGFVNMAQKEGDSFEQGIRVALEALLVSPNFLFRIEHDPNPTDPAATHQIDQYELASRVSYFLWSSLPDDELLACADENRLRKPGVLQAQVRRMLQDPKSRALVDNFGGQWLQLRNLDSVKPDPDRFPNFDEDLRDAMREETRLFFQTVIKEDRSILDFIDAKYTFLNERLAKHYGIPGVKGPQFRRVDLTGTERSGVLTQASVLTVSSYPTRTSAVIRGKWILENFLNAPPPPPPPNVPNIDETALGNVGTFRQQLEKHRASPSCASCHARMDPLGFGLENYDAIGAWRTTDGKFPVDASGVLPNAKAFNGPDQLKTILRSDKDAFAECLAEKMLTYALGRGLERYDKPTIHAIGQRMAASNFRFSSLVLEIVNSMPFQMGRGDGGKK